MTKNAVTHFFNEELAIKHGLDEAIFLNRIVHWIQLNKDNSNNEDIFKKTFRDGKTWTYNTQEALCKQFPFWNRHQIMRITKSLIDQDILVKGKYNKHIGNHTIWYALQNEGLFLVERDCKNSNNRINGNLQSGLLENEQSGLSENEQSIMNNKKDINKKEGKLSPALFIDICKRSDKGETLTAKEKEFVKRYREKELAALEMAPEEPGQESQEVVIETNRKMLEVHNTLKEKIGQFAYQNWFNNKILLTNDDGNAIELKVQTRFVKEFIEKNYLSYLQESITSHFGARKILMHANIQNKTLGAGLPV